MYAKSQISLLVYGKSLPWQKKQTNKQAISAKVVANKSQRDAIYYARPFWGLTEKGAEFQMAAQNGHLFCSLIVAETIKCTQSKLEWQGFFFFSQNHYSL